MRRNWPKEVKIPDRIERYILYHPGGHPACALGHMLHTFGFRSGSISKETELAEMAFAKCAAILEGEGYVLYFPGVTGSLNDRIEQHEQRKLCYNAMLEMLDYDTGDEEAVEIARMAEEKFGSVLEE